MITPSRRQLIGFATGGLILPARLLAADPPKRQPKVRDAAHQLPVVPPFTKEAANVRDARFGQGLSADGRALLPLDPHRRRWWLDTTASSPGGNGKSAATPFRTEGEAYGAMRGGDQLMIASGSVLSVPMMSLPGLSGSGNAFPTVIQSYDRTAPQDESRYGLLANKVVYRGPSAFIPLLKRGAAFIAFRGLTFDHTAAENRIFQYIFVGGIDSLLVEQCAFLAVQLSLNSLNGAHGHVIRQTAFQGQWSPNRHAQGIYTSDNLDTVIEDCVFDHCGWRIGLERSAETAEGGPTMFNHGLYAAVVSGGVLRRSVFLEPSSHGAQLRGNWASHDNVFIACPLALTHGSGTKYADDAPGGVMALCYRNIFTIAQPISPKSPRGFGVEVANTRPGSVIEQNLAVGPGREQASSAFAAAAWNGEGYEPNPTAILFERNTNAWSPNGYAQGTRGKQGWPDRVMLTTRDNIEYQDKVSFADPRRDGYTAAKALGFATLRDLGNAIVAEPGKPWAARIADHIRPGYAPRGLRPGASIKGAVRPDGSWNDV
jgi:hypothetical protein